MSQGKQLVTQKEGSRRKCLSVCLLLPQVTFFSSAGVQAVSSITRSAVLFMYFLETPAGWLSHSKCVSDSMPSFLASLEIDSSLARPRESSEVNSQSTSEEDAPSETSLGTAV